MNVNMHTAKAPALIAREVPKDLIGIIPEGSRVSILPSASRLGNRGRLVEVPLAGGDGDDWAKITDHQARILWNEGVRGRWFLNHNGHGKLYVRAWGTNAQGGKNTVMVARVLTGAGKSEVVSYRNGDPLDLRTENLEAKPRKKVEGAVGAVTRGIVVDPFQVPR